jgi:hypothetical protein
MSLDVILLSPEQIHEIIIDENESAIAAPEVIYFCPISDVFEVVEAQRKNDPSQESLQRIKTGQSMLQNREANRNLIVADLDADALKNTLFEPVGLEFEVSFWKPGSDFSLLPIENLGLLSLLAADQNWQTNLVEQYLARKER